MSIRSALIGMRAESGHTPLRTLAQWLACGLEYLALAALIVTVFLIGYWRPWTITILPHRPASIGYYPLLNIYASDIGAVCTALLWLIARLFATGTRQERSPLRLGPIYLTLSLPGLAVLAALSATQAIAPILSIEIAIHLFMLTAFVIAVINLRPPLWAIVAPLALLLAIEGVLSLLQVWAQSTLYGHFLYGWNVNAVASQSGASVVQMPSGARWLRAYGTFPHPNVLGGFLCMAIPLVAGGYLRLPWRCRVAWLLFASLALGVLALLLSFSRAAWLGILAGALWAGLFFWLKRGRRLKPRQKATPPGLPAQALFTSDTSGNHPGLRRIGLWAWLSRHHLNRQEGSEDKPTTSSVRRAWVRLAPLGLLCVGLGMGLVATLSPALQSRLLLDSSALEQRSINERIVLLKASAVFLSEHPWLGVGAGNILLVEPSYPMTRFIKQPIHNIPLLIGVEVGILGLLLWLIPPIVTLWMAWRRRFRLSSAGLAASAALVALLIPAQLDHYLWTENTARLFFWLTLTLAVIWCGQEGSKAKRILRSVPAADR